VKVYKLLEDTHCTELPPEKKNYIEFFEGEGYIYICVDEWNFLRIIILITFV